MTAHELAEQLEVSERTIYRDLDALGIAGIPVYAEHGPNGGYSLLDGYQTRLTGLTSTEVRTLFLAARAGHTLDLGMGNELEDALLKLTAALPQNARADIEQVQQRFHFDSSPMSSNERSISVLALIREALWHEHRLHLLYRWGRSQREQSRHLVDPYGLVAKGASWYLVCMSAGVYHVFPVDQIAYVERTEQVFVRPAHFDLASYWTFYQSRYEIQAYTYPSRIAPHRSSPGTSCVVSQDRGVLQARNRSRSTKKTILFPSSSKKGKMTIASQKKALLKKEQCSRVRASLALALSPTLVSPSRLTEGAFTVLHVTVF
jgi:predicted DNA-binding transcriptional regulator YafY